MHASISIVIPTYNRNEVFYTTLKSVYEAIQNYDIEVIVINDSKTNEVVIDEKYTDRVRLYKNPKSGVASARNLGASLSKKEYLLFIDDDMNITIDNLKYTLEFTKKYPNACLNIDWKYPVELQNNLAKNQFGRYMMAKQLISLEGWMIGSKDKWVPNKLYRVSSIASYYLLIPKALFDQVSGYDEKFPYAGFEDYDFAVRLKEASDELYLDTRTTVLHNEFDRVELANWLQRRVREGATRKVAVTQLGYSDHAIHYSVAKKMIYPLGSSMKRGILATLKLLPNTKVFDKLYRLILELLVGISMYEGYSKTN